MQLPIQLPIMKRDLSNHMYRPTTYILARYLANTMFNMFTPIIVILILFWSLNVKGAKGILEIEGNSENLWWLIAYGMVSNCIYCG